MGKVVFILSAGHSGSTLLDMAIGSVKGIFSCGELVHLSWQVFRGANPKDPQTYCSCRSDFENCSIWREVLVNIEKSKGISVYQHPKKFKLSMHYPIEYKRSKRALIIQNILMSLYPSNIGSFLVKFFYHLYKKSIENNWILIDEICNTTHSEYIVDSSKNILRFIFLKMYRPKDIKLIVLIRGLHGVASSSHRALSDKLIKKRVKAWMKLYKSRVINLLNQLGPSDYRIVKYEDFCENPVQKVNDIAGFLNIKESLSELNIDTGNMHLVAGNPIRYAGKISIRKDKRWEERLTKDQIDHINTMENRVNKLLNAFQQNYS